MIDLHTHILPAVDDGAQTLEESLKLLYVLGEQGVDKVVLSPHFYAHMESVETFLDRRNTQAEVLKKAVESLDVPLPSGYLAAEVQIAKNLWRYEENFDNLCINGTKYILLEPPYMYWENWVFDSIHEFINNDYLPIIAHVERFLRFNPKDRIERLLAMEVLFQSNASSYSLFRKRRFLYPLIKQDRIHSFVSDAHNLRTRFPEMADAQKRIRRRFGEGQLAWFDEQAEEVLKTAIPLFESKNERGTL